MTSPTGREQDQTDETVQVQEIGVRRPDGSVVGPYEDEREAERDAARMGADVVMRTVVYSPWRDRPDRLHATSLDDIVEQTIRTRRMNLLAAAARHAGVAQVSQDDLLASPEDLRLVLAGLVPHLDALTDAQRQAYEQAVTGL